MSFQAHFHQQILKLRHPLALVRSKEYTQALQALELPLARYQTLEDPQLRRALLIQSCSLKGLILFKLCQFKKSQLQLDRVLKISPQHETSLRRRLKLYLRTSRVEQALKDLQLLQLLSPESLDDSQILENFQNSISELQPARRNRLSTLLNNIIEFDQESQTLHDCSFLALRSIEKSFKKSSRKSVDFGKDLLQEFQKNGWQLEQLEQSPINYEQNNKQNRQLQQLFKDQEIQSCDQLKLNVGSSFTKSILARSSFTNQQHSKQSAFSLSSFQVSKIKNIDGKVSNGKSLFSVYEQQPKSLSVYKHSQGKSILKSNSIFKSQVKAEGSLLKLKNIEGKSSALRVSEPRQSLREEKKQHPLSSLQSEQPRREKLQLKESIRSIIKSVGSSFKKSVTIKEEAY